jgi:hypothetical protein
VGGGEISNFRPALSVHMYFTLKDANAQLPVVLFERKRRSGKTGNGFSQRSTRPALQCEGRSGANRSFGRL